MIIEHLTCLAVVEHPIALFGARYKAFTSDQADRNIASHREVILLTQKRLCVRLKPNIIEGVSIVCCVLFRNLSQPQRLTERETGKRQKPKGLNEQNTPFPKPPSARLLQFFRARLFRATSRLSRKGLLAVYGREKTFTIS